MGTGYVSRNRQLEAAVRECGRLNHPVIIWPEDVGRVVPADLPLIDLQLAERDFIKLDSKWCYSDEPLCLPTPGKAYAVVEEIEGSGGTKMNVVTFRPKTLDEKERDDNREAELYKLARVQDELIVRMGTLIAAIADQFIHPDISWEDYPEINDLLDINIGVGDAVQIQWGKVESGNEGIAGTTE